MISTLQRWWYKLKINLLRYNRLFVASVINIFTKLSNIILRFFCFPNSRNMFCRSYNQEYRKSSAAHRSLSIGIQRGGRCSAASSSTCVQTRSPSVPVVWVRLLSDVLYVALPVCSWCFAFKHRKSVEIFLLEFKGFHALHTIQVIPRRKNYGISNLSLVCLPSKEDMWKFWTQELVTNAILFYVNKLLFFRFN